LPGDVNDDGVVSSADLVLVQSAFSRPYNIFDDIDGNGTVDLTDYTLLRPRVGNRLT